MSAPIAAQYNGPAGAVLVNDKPLPEGAVVTGPPDVVAYLCTRADCEPIYETALEGAGTEDEGARGTE